MSFYYCKNFWPMTQKLCHKNMKWYNRLVISCFLFGYFQNILPNFDNSDKIDKLVEIGETQMLYRLTSNLYLDRKLIEIDSSHIVCMLPASRGLCCLKKWRLMMICNFKNYMLLILFTLIDYTHSRKCAFPIAVMLCSKLVHEH